MSNSRCSFVVDATSTSFSCDDEGRSTPFSSHSPSLAVKYSSVRMWDKKNYLKVDGKYTHTCMYEHTQACMHTQTQSLHLSVCHLTQRCCTSSHIISCPTFSHTSFTSQQDCKFYKLTTIRLHHTFLPFLLLQHTPCQGSHNPICIQRSRFVHGSIALRKTDS